MSDSSNTLLGVGSFNPLPSLRLEQGPGLQPRAQGARDKRPGDEVAWT